MGHRVVDVDEGPTVLKKSEMFPMTAEPADLESS